MSLALDTIRYYELSATELPHTPARSRCTARNTVRSLTPNRTASSGTVSRSRRTASISPHRRGSYEGRNPDGRQPSPLTLSPSKGPTIDPCRYRHSCAIT